jgi:hypothetical protein
MREKAKKVQRKGPGVAKVRRYDANEVTVTFETIPWRAFDPKGADGYRVNPPTPVFMSTDSATRKLMPVATGCLNYFPDALLCVSFISRVGNDKHNPGQPLHWAKEKNTDEPDAEVRHMLDFFRGLPPDPGLEALGPKIGHLASKAWRALADLQRACDAERAKVGGDAA